MMIRRKKKLQISLEAISMDGNIDESIMSIDLIDFVLQTMSTSTAEF